MRTTAYFVGPLVCLAALSACTPRPVFSAYEYPIDGYYAAGSGYVPVEPVGYVPAGFEPDHSPFAPPFIEPSRTYPADQHWYTADEYREGHFGEGHFGYAPQLRERAVKAIKERAHKSESHDYQYTYKYKLRGRVIKPDHFYVKSYRYSGLVGRAVPHDYSVLQGHENHREYDVHEFRAGEEAHVEIERHVETYEEHDAAPPRRPTKVFDARKMVEDYRRRMHDDKVEILPYGKGLRIEMQSEILFALDSDALKPEARALIRRLAEGLRADDGTEIQVNGYTDTSGTEEHNDLLSQARAIAVADALVANGVSSDRLTPVGFGETVLRVPTPDGVREPRNRRVEIVIVPATG